MAFRPSVLAEPGKDIISTFARSFESARQLVRQTQFDRRALALQDQEIRSREQDIEDRDFAAQQVRNRPGTFEAGTFPSSRDDELAAAFTPPGQGRERVGAGGLFPGAGPGGREDPGFAIDPATFFGPQGDPSVALPSPDLPDDGGPPPASIATPPELLERFRETGARAAPSLRIFDEPDELGAGGVGVIDAEPTPDFLRPPVQGFFGEPSDAVTERGGRRFSQRMADQIALDSLEAETRRAAAVTESLPSTQRDIAEQEREVDVEEAEVEQKDATRAGQAAAAREIHGDAIPEGATDEQAISMGKTLDAIRLRETPTGASVTAAQRQIDRGRATVLSVFERKKAAATSAAARRTATAQEQLLDFQFKTFQRTGEGPEGEEFDPTGGVDDAFLMEEAITSALVAGTITPEQAADMSANAASLLTAAGVTSLGPGGGSGPLDPETIAFWLEEAEGTLEERVAQWQADGLTPEAVAQLRTAAGG
jgi:hypothetical protein